MNPILQQYYHIQLNVTLSQYFLYLKNYYYLYEVKDIHQFLEVYQLYRYYMNQCGCKGYSIVKNQFGELHSLSHVLLMYHQSSFDMMTYLKVILHPLPQKMQISHIKEQWIEKIDKTKNVVKEYAYSYKQNIELMSLIYYYTGIGENCICLLNEILSLHPSSYVSSGLALKHPISSYTYDLLNPAHYTISSRMRMIAYLLRSEVIDCDTLAHLLHIEYFDICELMYLYARIIYPSMFFDDVLHQRMDGQKIDEYFLSVKKEKLMIKKVSDILSFYVALPKISWINEENML